MSALTTRLLALPILGLLALAVACQNNSQLDEVIDLTEGAYLVRLSCLDTNDDGMIDAGDAQSDQLLDVTGDGAVDQDDADVTAAAAIEVADGRPSECAEGGTPEPDWMATEPPQIDCAAGDRGVLLYGVGGGEVDFTDAENAAGVRWMMDNLSDELDNAGVPHYSASVSPNLHLGGNEHLASETWSKAYLTTTLQQQPCLGVVFIGHSYGAIHVKTIAAHLEAEGLGGQVAMTTLIDPWAALYGGTTDVMPQESPILNFFHIGGEGEVSSQPIDQPNAENVDTADFVAPEDGEEGGDLVPINHVTIDNSPDVLEVFLARALEELGLAG